MSTVKRVKGLIPGKSLVQRLRSRRRARIARAQYGKRAPNKPGVLLTGDQGKLGSRVARAISGEYRVIGFDMKAGFRETLDNKRLLRRRMQGCRYVVHMAGIPHPNKGDISTYVRSNVIGSLNVMEEAARAGVKRFIFVSSVGFYGCNIDGRLNPLYFPIDENHPPASAPGRSVGGLDEYNRSKLLAEEMLAYYGTNGAFEAIALRLAPANSKAHQYPVEDSTWRDHPGYRRAGLWTNCHPDSVTEAIDLALKAKGPFAFETFNVCDRYAPACIDIPAFLAEEYPEVPLKKDFSASPTPSLISSDKAAQMLGFRPCEEVGEEQLTEEAVT